jgi:hypothetical protein
METSRGMRAAWCAMLLCAGLIAGGCYARAGYGGAVMVYDAPPAARVTVRPVAPGLGHVWVDGYWGWSGAAWTWIDGYWMPPRAGHFFVQPRWVPEGRGWRWAPGGWHPHSRGTVGVRPPPPRGGVQVVPPRRGSVRVR